MVLARGFAYLIDCCFAFLLVALTQIVFFSPLRSVAGMTGDWFHAGINTQLHTLATISISVWMYFAVLESSGWQATVGKRITGLKVGDSISHSKIGLLRAVFRTIGKLLPWELAHIGNNLPTPIWYTDSPEFRIAFAFSGLLLAAYILVMFTNSGRRTIHDILVSTEVTKRKPVMA